MFCSARESSCRGHVRAKFGVLDARTRMNETTGVGEGKVLEEVKREAAQQLHTLQLDEGGV